jgi:hypothetical protein
MRLFVHRIMFPVFILLFVQGPAIGQISASGTVFDPDGAPVSGCTLRLESTSGAFLQQTLTDEHGNYRLLVSAQGDYVVIASPVRGFAGASVPILFA